MTDDEYLNSPEVEWSQIISHAHMLLTGLVEGLDEGRPRMRYPNEREEKLGRAAMALLLRSGRPLPQEFRNRLAALFDPKDDDLAIEDRKLIFKRRTAGRRRDHLRDTAIAMRVYRSIEEGSSAEAAFQKAAEFFGLSPSAVRDIWGHGKTRAGFREVLELIHGPLKVVK